MGETDDGERIARLEERLKVVEADLAAWKRMVFGGLAVVVAMIWNKIAGIIGMSQ